MAEKGIRVSVPGRICLFGEHQDYLRLPVIAAAISKRITVEGMARTDSQFTIDLPDIGTQEVFSLGKDSLPIPYVRERDYFRSAVNVLRRGGFVFPRGYDCRVHGEIPISAGVSSSSALVVAWINFLAMAGDTSLRLSAELSAKHAVQAEVLEFNEPGGMMDQYTTANGGILAIDFFPEFAVEQFHVPLKSFVLGDSKEPKNTKFVLANVKNKVLEIVKRITSEDSSFQLHTATLESIQTKRGLLDAASFSLLEGTVKNHAITLVAKKLFHQTPFDHHTMGKLLNDHQQILRDVCRISTPKIDRMTDAALGAGAYGCKITGSGGGGCMFAYAPENTERVAEAIERAGGAAYVVTVDEGTRIETFGMNA